MSGPSNLPARRSLVPCVRHTASGPGGQTERSSMRDPDKKRRTNSRKPNWSAVPSPDLDDLRFLLKLHRLEQTEGLLERDRAGPLTEWNQTLVTLLRTTPVDQTRTFNLNVKETWRFRLGLLVRVGGENEQTHTRTKRTSSPSSTTVYYSPQRAGTQPRECPDIPTESSLTTLSNDI